jgi:hypothetical protein
MGAHQSILLRLLLLLGLILPFMKAVPDDWPNGLVLHEDSTSPDGHYGILVARSSHVDDGKTYLIARKRARTSQIISPIYKLIGRLEKLRRAITSSMRIIAIWMSHGHLIQECAS